MTQIFVIYLFLKGVRHGFNAFSNSTGTPFQKTQITFFSVKYDM